jgi:vacuolar-type H+-ATPase subunit H
MPRRKVTEEEKKKIRKKVQQEFPGCKALQDIHFYRYIKELEWQTMSAEEVVKDIKEGASKAKKEIKNLKSSTKSFLLR